MTWEDPPREGAAPVLSVAGFEGPLDWLLACARARRIDLARLSIVALIEAFAEALATALADREGGHAALDRWGDWLVMAATLTLLRSRLLLPPDAPEAREAWDEAESLRRQLVNRAEMARVADWLDRRPQLGRDCFVRGVPEVGRGERVGDITELLRACLAALRVPDQAEALYRPRPPPLWQVPDAMARIKELLVTLPDGSKLDVFLPEISTAAPERDLRCRSAVASTLVAGLELARLSSLAMSQEAPWHPIVMSAPTQN